jgi:uncharacterized phage protein gp47/JayE
MTLALTAAGLQTQTQDQIVAEMVAKLRATFGTNLNTSATSIMGQLVNIVSELRSLDQQTLLAVYRSFDPNTAEGVALDRLATLTGSTRNGATSSVVQGFLTFSGIATVNDGDLIENSDNSTQWQAINGPYTSAGPFPETIAATFQAVDTGPILANANTNWALVTVIAGLDGFANPADDAALGRDQETDPDFRVRRQVELFSQNVGGLAAIRAVVSRVDGVETVRVYHNPDTQPADADGIPFKAFNVLVETQPTPPPVDLQNSIANAIWSATGAGGEPYGTDYAITVADEEGQPQTVRFDLVDQVDIFVDVTINTLGTEQVISTNIADVVTEAILSRARSDFSDIGRNQLGFEYVGIVFDLQNSGQISGAVSVTVQLSRVSAVGPFADPVEVGIRERPNFESPNIAITVVAL